MTSVTCCQVSVVWEDPLSPSSALEHQTFLASSVPCPIPFLRLPTLSLVHLFILGKHGHDMSS